MKMIDLVKHPDARQSNNGSNKEATVHRMMSHPNIIRYYGQRSQANMEYIFLEYASGGELFDRIEPDIGMPLWEAQKYFKQLISAVEYLHQKGVAHRDLKPENLLLDSHDNLKVSDFGMATVFRMNGKERRLEKRCGSLPYVAPEVLTRAYYAEPADIWSCGIILVTLMAGELPWDRAGPPCEEYAAWLEGKYMDYTPWKKLDKAAFSFVKNILVHSPSSRFKIEDIKNHRWFQKNLYNDGQSDHDTVDSPSSKSPRIDEDNFGRNCLSQPEYTKQQNTSSIHIDIENRGGFSFSQPAAIGDLLLSTQPLQATQNSSQNSSQNGSTPFQRLVKRMTRFFVKTNCDETAKRLVNSLDTKNYDCRISENGIVTVTTVDRRNMQLIFKAIMVEMDGKILVDFRLSKGCGLEFKRRFVKIKDKLDDIIMKGPVSWPIAIATNTLP
ncbi:serine/threonine-protein kinase grp isoform X2 [Aphidius gifuensis]|nr:serine/threonine-protein kinase grp isoform X2 [Aphidius gifuensis]